MKSKSRRRKRKEPSIAEVSSTANTTSSISDLRLQTGVGLAALILSTWAYWPTLFETIRAWGSNPDYSHGYFVVPLAAWLLWQRRKSLPLEHLRPAWAGLLLIVLAAIIRVIGARIYLPRLDGWSIPIWIGGVCWLLGGSRFLRWCAPSVAFLWFMFPLPGTVETFLSLPLQRIATDISTFALVCLGQPAIAEGNTILLGEQSLDVERACSGLRIIYGILALAVGYSLVFRTRGWTTVILLASVLPVALAANAFRVTITAFVYQYVSDSLARVFTHDLAGFVVIPLAVVLFSLIALGWTRLTQFFQENRARAIRWLTAGAVSLATVLVGVFVWHGFQQGRVSAAFLTRATTLEEQEEWGSAAEYLSRYLRVHPDNHEVRARLAETYDRFDMGTVQLTRVLALYRLATVALPERTDLRLRQAELALEVGRYDEAIQVAEAIETSDTDGEEAVAAAARINALAVVGKLAAEGETADTLTWQKNAVDALGHAIQLNPQDIDLPVRLAGVYQVELDDTQAPERQAKADQVIEDMLKANQEFPNAWLARYRYRRTYHLPPEASNNVPEEIDSDLDRAIELGRDNPDDESFEVLLAAGQRAELREVTDQAIMFYERAIEIRPTDYRGYFALGSLHAMAETPEAWQKSVQVWRQGLEKSDQAELDLKPRLAAVLLALGRTAEAEQELQDLEKLLPYLPEPKRSSVDLSICMLRGQAQAADGKVRQAVSSIRLKLTSLPPDSARAYSTQFANAWLRLADIYAEIPVYDQAAAACERAGNLDPSVTSWRLKAAQMYQLSGRPDAAIGVYRQVGDNDSNPELWLKIARLQLQAELGRPPDRRNWNPFRQAIRKASELGGEVTVLLAEYNLALGTEQSAQQSVDLLQRALEQQPDAHGLWRTLASVYERMGNYDRALKAIDEFEKHAPEPTSALRLRLSVLSRAGRYAQAKEMLEQGLAASDDPDRQYELQRLLVELELSNGNREQAIRTLEALSMNRPSDVELLRRLAGLAWIDRDWTALEGHEKRLSDIEGEDGTLWRYFRARRLLQQVQDVGDSRFQEVLALAGDLQTLRPNWPRLHALRGQIAGRQGIASDAILAFQEAIRLGDRSVGTAVALIDLLSQQNRFQEAEQLVDQFRRDVLGSSSLASLATNVYVQQGESEEAVSLAKDWVRQHPDDARGYVRLGRTLLMTTPADSTTSQQARSEAKRAFRRAIQLAPNDLAGWYSLFSYYAQVHDRRTAYTALDALTKQIEPAKKSLLLAQLYQAIGNAYRAAPQFRAAVDLATDDTRVRALELAAQFFRDFDPEFCEQYCRRLPDSPTANTILITLLAQRQDDSSRKEAFKLLEKCRNVIPSSLHKRLDVSLLLGSNEQRDRGRAIQILEELVSVPQTAAGDQLLLASAYEQDGRVTRAAQILKALANRPDAIVAHIKAHIEFLQRQGEANPAFVSQAERELARLRRNPENTLHALIALQHGIRGAKQFFSPDDPTRQQNIQQHVDLFLDASRGSRGDASGDRVEGLMIILLQEDCIEEVLRICQLDPPLLDTDQMFWRLVVALVRAQASQEIFGEFDPFVSELLQESRDRDNAQILYSAGFFHYFHRNVEQSIALLKEALAAAPDRTDVMNLLAFATATQGKELEDALQFIDIAISAEGPIPGYLDTKAVILLRQGKLESARALLDESLQSAPYDPLIWLHLSVVLSELAEPAVARDAWLQARKLNISRATQSPLDQQMADEMVKKFGS